MSPSINQTATLATKAAAIPVNPPLGCLYVALGDSITQGDGDETNKIAANSWVTYMAIASNGTIRLLRNSGIGGQKTSDMLPRFEADVAAYKPQTVMIATGTNDNNALQNTLPDLENIIKKALATNISVVLFNIPPKGIPAGPVVSSVTLTPSTASGTLPAGTYGYVVTCETVYGQCLPSTEVTATLAAPGTITVDWTRPIYAPDYRYRIYRRNPSGSLGFIGGVGFGFSQLNYPQWVDNGSVATPTTAPPATDATGGNYSGIAPALHDNMIQTQKVIKKLALKYKIPLVDQYTLLTDPATGRYKQGYSQDGTHPIEQVHKLMGQNAWNTLSGLFPSHSPYLCTDPNDYSGMLTQLFPNGAATAVAGALLPQNVAMGAGAIPNNWGSSGTANFTTNLGTDPGVAGNAFTVTTTSYNSRVLDRFIPSVTPGHRVRVAFKFKATGIDANNGYVRIEAQCTGATSGPNYLTSIIIKSDIPNWSVWTAEETIPPGTTGIDFRFIVLGRNVSGSIAQVTIDDLTAQGLL